MTNLPHALIMLAAGVGIPLLAALNSQLGARVGSPAAAAVILFLVALGLAVAVLLLTGPGALARLPGQPPHLFLGGTFVAFYVISVTYIAPKMGVGNAVFFVLMGQLLSSAAIDHFGLFGAQIKPLGLQRAAGIAVMGLGVLLAVRA